MNHILIFALSTLCLVACTKPILQSEEDALVYLVNVENNKEELDSSLIVECVEKSWWKAGEKMITLSYANKMDVSKEFSQAISSQRTNIQKLQNLINQNKEDYLIIAPSFQWAQGKEDLKMNIKLSHKWDTPSTLGCSIESVKFDSTSVYFEAKCVASKKKYILSINLMNRINPEACDWSEASVGRIVINMKKYESGLWDSIMVKLKNMPKNMHTWWSMKDKLEKEDKVKEDIEQQKLDEQRRVAETQYWEEKKRRENAEDMESVDATEPVEHIEKEL